MINGNTNGIKKSLLERLERLQEGKIDPAQFLPLSLAEELCDITGQINREVCLYISRSGEIRYVAVGEGDRVALEEMTLRRSAERLSGLRCIHTHPQSPAAILSAVDIESLKRLRFDAMTAIGELDGRPVTVAAGFLTVNDRGETDVLQLRASVQELPQEAWLEQILESDLAVRPGETNATKRQEPEKLLLIGRETDSLEELARLADTAGGQVAQTAQQKTADGIPGKGKLQELALTVQAQNIDLAVFDDELSGVQQKNMEEALGVPVIDRTALILDIFALRAKTREGKMQVELAQLKYNYSRLAGLGTELSRLGGGIGTRGPGESKLETDRRHIRRRMHELQEQLSVLAGQRELRRKRREKNAVPSLALVGYTNAGKSSLLSALSGSEVFIEDKLFATLDPLTRKCTLEGGAEVCITDTVGFIKKLPHQLVEAFRSTLEEAAYGDILLHVCDASSPQMVQQMQAVDEVLAEIGAANLPRILIINKIDLLPAGERPVFKNAVYISAKTGEGLEALKEKILQALSGLRSTAEVLVPYSRGDILAAIHDTGQVLESEHREEGTFVHFTAPKEDVERIKSRLEKKG